jgi:thiosulfate dehydrogenase [quinone] large subunit
MNTYRTQTHGKVINDPPVARFLFNDTRSSIIWLFVRLWAGYSWFDAGMHKVQDPAWVSTGEAVKNYWLNAVKIPATGRPPISFDWYRDFLNSLLSSNAYTWFAPLIAWGEVLVGIGLIVGGLTGVAAFFGALMNWSFIMAGSASTNGMLLVAAIALMMAWKVAGFLGVDYFLLRWLGVPWTLTREAETKSFPPKSMPA